MTVIGCYARLLQTPDVRRLVVIALLTRLTTPVLSLALMIVVFEERNSYQVAGLVLTAHALALAVVTPASGRLADRHGARRTLTAFIAAHTAAYVLLLVVLSTPVPAAVLVTVPAILGGTTPPAGSVTRAAWPRLVPADLMQTAYAVDSATNELMFVAGPVLVAALLTVMPAHLIVAMAGAAFLAGVLLLIFSPATRRPAEPDHGRPQRQRGHLLGPIAHRPTLVVLCAAALAAFVFGCIRVATLASATAFGAPAFAGILMALLSAGTLAGGLAYGARRWPISGRHALILLCLAEAAVLAGDALAPALPVLTVLVLATGLLGGPRDALQASLLATHAETTHRTEVFAWLNTFMWAGYAAGTAVAGHLTAPNETGAKAFAVAAIAALVAAAGVTAGYRPDPADPGPLVGVGDDQLHPGQPTGGQAA